MKPNIPKIYPRDHKVLKALALVGCLDHDQMKIFLREKRISGYLKDGLIQREIDSKPGKESSDRVCYKLTKAGHEFCRQKLGMEYTYHAQSPTHDLRIAERYLSLSPEEQDTWQTETEIRDRLEQQIQATHDLNAEDSLRSGKLSAPDAVYRSQDGTEVAFEVVTSNYSMADIQAKIDAAKLLHCSYEEVRV